MIATNKNYDVVFLKMRASMPHLESPLKKELGKLLSEIKEGLTDLKKIKPLLDNMLPRVFNFRIKAIKWLMEEGRPGLSGIMDEIYPILEDLKHNPKLEILADNILFAVRCNKKVANALMTTGHLSEEKFASGSFDLPIINYQQFLATLAYSVPDNEAAKKMADWVNASLYIEFIVLSAVIINDENLKVPTKVINELSFLIADAAQDYSALAIELGIMKQRFESPGIFSGKAGKSFIKEQKDLANLGINDFAQIF